MGAIGSVALAGHFPLAASVPHYSPDRHFRIAAVYAAFTGMAFLIYRVESRSLAKARHLGDIPDFSAYQRCQ
jgi:hypothetical protein